MKRNKLNHGSISSHLSGFMLTFGSVTLAISVLVAGVIFSTRQANIEIAFAQNDPNSPVTGPVALPTTSSNTSTPTTTSTTSTPSTTSSTTTSTGSTTSNTATTTSTTSPVIESPTIPTLETSDIVIADGNDEIQEIVPVDLTPESTLAETALNSSLDQSTPRSGGFEFVFSGILIFALAGWYYYYNNAGNTKTPLKLAEKKIGKSK